MAHGRRAAFAFAGRKCPSGKMAEEYVRTLLSEIDIVVHEVDGASTRVSSTTLAVMIALG